MAGIEYFLYVKGIEIGPFDLLYIRNKLRKNEINPDVFVKTRRGSNWQPLYDVMADEVPNWPAPFGYQDTSKRPPLPVESSQESPHSIEGHTPQDQALAVAKAQAVFDESAGVESEGEAKGLPLIFTIAAGLILIALGGVFLYAISSSSTPKSTTDKTAAATSHTSSASTLPAILLGTYINAEAKTEDDESLKNRKDYTVVLKADMIILKIHSSGETITYTGRYRIIDTSATSGNLTASVESPAYAALSLNLNILKGGEMAFLKLAGSSSFIKLIKQH